jgi:anti-sigma B factor antagonist
MALTETSFVTLSHRAPMEFAARDADCTVVWVRGEHDIATVAALSETLAWAIALDDADVVVDLSRVTFMDASTVGAVVHAREELWLRARSLSVRAPSRSARRILEVCGLGHLVEVEPDDDAATAVAGSALASWVAVRPLSRTDRSDNECPMSPSSRGRASSGLVGRRVP